MHIYPNFFYLINLSVDEVYNANFFFWIAFLFRKIGRKITFRLCNFDNFFSLYLVKLIYSYYLKKYIFSIIDCTKNTDNMFVYIFNDIYANFAQIGRMKVKIVNKKCPLLNPLFYKVIV
jgi:hypothetical protein